MSTDVITLQISTSKEEELINISRSIQETITGADIKNGAAIIFCPHTTAGITINENADPDVVRDLLWGFDKVYPKSGNYKHFEGNSHAHLKASTAGVSQTVIIHDGRLLLGTWQGIYFCEFDGPRKRKVYVKLLEG